jgi:hypothetical protein
VGIFRTGTGLGRLVAVGTLGATLAGLLAMAPGAGAATPTTLFRDASTTSAKSDAETNSVELGLRIRADVDGSLRAIRFLKSPDESATTHTVNVWSEDGQRLSTGKTVKETRRGWQQASLAKPLQLRAGKNYVISYHTTRYMATNHYFSSNVSRGGITAFGNRNGVFAYGASAAFPKNSYNDTNYWVDAVFRPADSNSTSTTTVPATTTAKPVSTTAKPVPTTAKPVTTSTPTTSTSTPSGSGVCTGTATHTPGGPDGMGGCWPNEGNTGVPSGTTLAAYTGPCTITQPGTVIDKKTVDCNLDIRAKDVVITKSKINGAIIVDGSRCGSASYNVSDSRIHVSDINLRGLMSCSFTANRVDVSGGQSMAWCDTCTISDSYLHSPLEDPTGAAANHAAHNSTVRISKNAVLRHNTFWCAVKEYAQPNGQDTSGCSANQTGYSHDGAAPYNSLIERNLYMPTTGGYCAYGGSTTGNLTAVHDIVFKDNVFKRGTNKNDKGGYTCGYYGAVSSFDSSRPGNQWINNHYDDGTILNP